MMRFQSPLTAAIALACIVFNSPLAFAQSSAPVDANPAPPPAAIAPAPSTDDQPDANSAAPPDDNGTPPAQPSDTGAPAPPVTTNDSGQIDVNQASRDPRALNPVLNPTDNEIRDNLNAGRDIGASKKDLLDVLAGGQSGFAFRNGGMFGEKRRTTGVATWVTPGLEARWLGFVEARNFAGDDGRQADFTTIQSEVTAPQRTLTFVVEIGDLIPGRPDDPSPTQINSAYVSLTGTRFVLSDDHDNNYDPMSVEASPNLMVRQDFYDAIAPGPDHLTGSVAFGAPAPESHRLVLRRDNYRDVAEYYIVTFNAFNPDGSARINRDVHQITLRIITPDFPKNAVFDLSKIP